MVTGDRMRNYGVVSGVPFPSRVGYEKGLCLSKNFRSEPLEIVHSFLVHFLIQCFDAIGWMTGRASGL